MSRGRRTRRTARERDLAGSALALLKEAAPEKDGREEKVPSEKDDQETEALFDEAFSEKKALSVKEEETGSGGATAWYVV